MSASEAVFLIVIWWQWGLVAQWNNTHQILAAQAIFGWVASTGHFVGFVDDKKNIEYVQA